MNLPHCFTVLFCVQTVEGKSDEKKHEIVPRQFLDLGPTSIAETDEQSQSSSGERTRDLSGSPQNLPENGKGDVREESPESETQGWVQNKASKLSPPPKAIDQSAEATMRKARVSVRARSEAPMVSFRDSTKIPLIYRLRICGIELN